MKVAIVGSRTGVLGGPVREYVRSLPADTVVISGGARGVDLIAEDEALRCGLVVVRCIPPWNRPDGTTDKGAGFKRNAVIVELCDRMVAFHDGQSRGTQDAIERARRAGKPVEVRT